MTNSQARSFFGKEDTGGISDQIELVDALPESPSLLPESIREEGRESFSNVLKLPPFQGDNLEQTQVVNELIQTFLSENDLTFGSKEEMQTWFIERAAGDSEAQKQQVALAAIGHLRYPGQGDLSGFTGILQDQAHELLTGEQLPDMNHSLPA